MELIARNLKLYPVYVALQGTYCWLPVFFLYFLEHLSLAEVLALEAIYYVGVVVMEVPSGYFSDRVGRRATLILAQMAQVFGYAIFFFGAPYGFWAFALAQVLLAVGLAFNSGTGTSLHLESLTAVGQGERYGDREALLSRVGLFAGAFGALAGGALGSWSLGSAYALSGGLACAGLVTAIALVEPEAGSGDPGEGFLAQCAACLRLGTRRPLGWFMGATVLAIVGAHVPYELYQPYLQLWGADDGLSQTAMVSGVHTALVLGLAGVVGRYSVQLAGVVGTRRLVLLALLAQLGLIAVMGSFVHVVVVVILVSRGVPMVLFRAPMMAFVAPRVDPSMRATYLSLQSLAGRLAYGALLLVLGWAGLGAAEVSFETLRLLLTIAGVVVGAGWVTLWAFGRREVG